MPEDIIRDETYIKEYQKRLREFNAHARETQNNIRKLNRAFQNENKIVEEDEVTDLEKNTEDLLNSLPLADQEEYKTRLKKVRWQAYPLQSLDGAKEKSMAELQKVVAHLKHHLEKQKQKGKFSSDMLQEYEDYMKKAKAIKTKLEEVKGQGLEEFKKEKEKIE